MIVTVFLFSGCPMVESDLGGGSLHGTWVSSWDEKFVINLGDDTLEHYGWDGSFCFNGTIQEIVYINSSGSAGFIFIEYIDIADWWGKWEGNFAAILFHGLTSSTVNLGNGADKNYKTPTAANLEVAKAMFTEGTIDKYFMMDSLCIRQ